MDTMYDDAVEVLVSDSVIVHRADLLRDLWGAVGRREFRLHYQPIVQLRTGHTVGVEALVRWQHPQLGLLHPARFLSVAEQSGSIVALGRWVVEESCSQLAWWDREYPEMPLTMSINVSVHQLLDSDFAAETASLLWRRGIDPRRLVMEITESFAACSERARQQIQRLKALGVRLAIDDFGTGYSSLSTLRECPFDIVKIDRTFVAGVARDVRDQQLTHCIIELGHLFGAEVNAEGLEEHEQCVVLGALGCDFGQGYYFAQPLDTRSFNAFMHSKCRTFRRGGAPDASPRHLNSGVPAPRFGYDVPVADRGERGDVATPGAA